MPTANRYTGITVLCLAATALAAPARAQSTVQLDIRSVVVSYKTTGEPDTLLISGINFGSLPGVVRLNGIGQTVTHWTPTWIAANAEDVVEPGTYQLDVRRTDSTGMVFRDEADVTIGATGPRGPAGPEGPQGAAGISAYEVVVENPEITISTNETITVAATCPQGKRVLGGSCQGLGYGGHLYLVSSSNYPYDPNWNCQWANPDEPKTIRLRVTAICATVP